MLLTDKCPEGWITYENSCYKLETSSNLKNLDQEGGLRHCKNTYNGILSVMNSREEADYLSNYVYGVSVSHHNNPFLYLHLPLCVSFIAIYHFTYQWNSIPEFGYRSHSQHKISGISRWYHHDWWYHGWQGEYKLHRSLWSRLHNRLCPNQRGYWCSN